MLIFTKLRSIIVKIISASESFDCEWTPVWKKTRSCFRSLSPNILELSSNIHSSIWSTISVTRYYPNTWCYIRKKLTAQSKSDTSTVENVHATNVTKSVCMPRKTIWKVKSLAVRVIEFGRVRLLVLPLRIYWVSVYIRSCHRQYEPSSQQLLSREFGEAYKNVLICSDIPFGHGTCKYGTVGILHLPEYVVAFLRGWSFFDSFKTRLHLYVTNRANSIRIEKEMKLIEWMK